MTLGILLEDGRLSLDDRTDDGMTPLWLLRRCGRIGQSSRHAQRRGRVDRE